MKLRIHGELFNQSLRVPGSNDSMKFDQVRPKRMTNIPVRAMNMAIRISNIDDSWGNGSLFMDASLGYFYS